MKLFVYATLKERAIQRKVLGHIEPDTQTRLHGFAEMKVRIDGTEYPTIVPRRFRFVRGEILEVSKDDLTKLDAWENKYKRELVRTSAGLAWAYRLEQI